MAKKPVVTSEVTESVGETPQVVVVEQVPAEEKRPLSVQTLAEMEEGRRTLAANAAKIAQRLAQTEE